MPLSAFQQFCADTGCPCSPQVMALWTQRNDAVAVQERLKASLDMAQESIAYWMKSSDVLLAEVTKLKEEREQMLINRNDLRIQLNAAENRVQRLILNPPVPDGKVLVPVEPTAEMLLAGKHTVKGMDNGEFESEIARCVYLSMLKAAQQGE